MTCFVRAGLSLLAVGALFAPGSARAAVTCSSAPATVSAKSGRVDVFVIGSDGKAYQRTLAGRDEKSPALGKWVDLGGQCRHGIAAIRHKGRVDLFTVAKSGHLVQRTHTKDGWKDWADVGATPGGQCTSAPAAVIGMTGRIDVFVAGKDKKIHQATYEGERTGWKWNTIGGDTKYGPGAARHTGMIELFGIARSGHVVQKTFKDKWTDFVDRGAPADRVKADSAPAALAGTTGNFDVFVIGDNKKCYQLSGSGTTANWSEIGGDCRYGVGACAHMKSKTIFTVARSGHLVRKGHDGSAWDKDWVDMGQPVE
jgi:hypothetical protein